jgi:large subunit ribosomal protein L5
MSRLQKRYKEDVKKALQEKFAYSNDMLIPKLVKIIISMGIAEATKDKNALQDCINEMTSLSGQKPILTRARTSVANFKLREGQAIGVKVTLRKKRMYDFLDRFSNIVSPRIRDFRGFSRRCDGMGNYSLGLEEQQIFPEINLDAVKRTQGMNITFVTTAQTDEECIELLSMLGLPFKVSE